MFPVTPSLSSLSALHHHQHCPYNTNISTNSAPEQHLFQRMLPLYYQHMMVPNFARPCTQHFKSPSPPSLSSVLRKTMPAFLGTTRLAVDQILRLNTQIIDHKTKIYKSGQTSQQDQHSRCMKHPLHHPLLIRVSQGAASQPARSGPVRHHGIHHRDCRRFHSGASLNLLH